MSYSIATTSMLVCAFLLTQTVSALSPPAETNPTVSDEMMAAASALVSDAQAMYAKGPTHASKVIELLQQALVIDPVNFEAVGLMGITHFGTGQFAKAVEWYERAIELSKQQKVLRPRIHIMKARALLHAGRAEESWQIVRAFQGIMLSSDEADFVDSYNKVRQAVEVELYQNLFISASAAASRKALELGFDPEEYVFVVVHKDSHPYVLEDSDIKPYVTRIAIEKDWWNVILIPNTPKTTTGICVLLEKESLKMRGYITSGEPARHPRSDAPQAWQTITVYTDRNVPALALKALYSAKDAKKPR